jgi:mxaJ protein
MVMKNFKYKKMLRLGVRTLLGGAIGLMAMQSYAADLNICAGQDEMPYSNKNQEGFENSIATVLGKAMNKKVNFVWWKDPRYTVRDFLDQKKCDVVLGLDKSDPRVLTTNAYYKTSYVFITRTDREINLTSWNDDYLKNRNFRIGVLPDSPGKVMLLQINRFDDMFDYLTELTDYQSTRNKFVKIDVSKLVTDVENQHLHAAMLWAPEAARYVRDSKVALNMVAVKDDAKKVNGDKVSMQYAVVMGVRKDDKALQAELNRAIVASKTEIDAILKHEGIPLLPL